MRVLLLWSTTSLCAERRCVVLCDVIRLRVGEGVNFRFAPCVRSVLLSLPYQLSAFLSAQTEDLPRNSSLSNTIVCFLLTQNHLLSHCSAPYFFFQHLSEHLCRGFIGKDGIYSSNHRSHNQTSSIHTSHRFSNSYIHFLQSSIFRGKQGSSTAINPNIHTRRRASRNLRSLRGRIRSNHRMGTTRCMGRSRSIPTRKQRSFRTMVRICSNVLCQHPH